MAQSKGKSKTGASSAAGGASRNRKSAPKKKTAAKKADSERSEWAEEQMTVQDLFDLVRSNVEKNIQKNINRGGQPTSNTSKTKKSDKPRSEKTTQNVLKKQKAQTTEQKELNEEPRVSLRKKPRDTYAKEEPVKMEDEKDVLPSEEEEDGEEITEIDWQMQMISIIFCASSLLLLFLIVFKGESLWTVIHNFLFGIFGNMVILWDVLLVIFGYMYAKQKRDDFILEITRVAAGLIVFVDILNYVLIQSNGYRNVYNELTYSFFDLIGQIYNDGSQLGGTGLISGMIGELLLFLFGKIGAAIITGLVILALVMVLSHTTPFSLIANTKKSIVNFWKKATMLFSEEGLTMLREKWEEITSDKDGENYVDDYYIDDGEVEYAVEPDDMALDVPEEAEPAQDNVPEASSAGSGLDQSVEEIINKVSLKKKKKKSKAEELQEQTEAFARQVDSGEASDAQEGEKEYQYPPVRLLIAPKNTNESDDRRELTETAEKLITTLEEYGVKASISDISRGPTVTRYEINPAPGVKINKITNLSNDIALRLAAQSIRIEAPIPGKPAVGIEIPNQNKQMVRIREILGSRQFMEAKGALTVALGKDIEGNIVLCDLSKMPHLLIAGSTGSGKSVCVNSMLMSLLYKYSPKEVRMVLIDPKSVEFDMYNGIPHLLVPVVCEPKKAAGALQWAVSEMLKRYGMLKEHGARNIDNYNRLAEETGEFEKLCRIVIVIDEMADLMIASPKEVEDAIARLAAMARAAGMYMVLATQRPSVDVITGTIKNNIPSRIALAVSSQIDSRTILDEGGAENLIGYGDMLYHPMGSSKHVRVQGCFVDDIEVDRVIKFVKQNGSAEYDDSIADEIERNSMDDAGESMAEFDGKDEFFDKAVEVVTEAGQASTSMLQRRLGVGYARAGRIIDQLEEQGIIGPYEGSKPRAVLITRTQWLEMTMSKLPAGKNDPLVRSHSQYAAQTLDNGHEEITARQSEFFNAQEEDDEDETEYEIMEEAEDIEESEESEDIQDIEDIEDIEDTEDAASDSATEDDADKFFYKGAFAPARDLTMFFDDDSNDVDGTQEQTPVVKDFTSFLTKKKDTRKADKGMPSDVSDLSADMEETAEDDYDMTLPVVRDLTGFFDDPEPFDETLPEDIPPWEDVVSSAEGEEEAGTAETEEDDDSSDFEDYDDDDILSAPWVRKL